MATDLANFKRVKSLPAQIEVTEEKKRGFQSLFCQSLSFSEREETVCGGLGRNKHSKVKLQFNHVSSQNAIWSDNERSAFWLLTFWTNTEIRQRDETGDSCTPSGSNTAEAKLSRDVWLAVGSEECTVQLGLHSRIAALIKTSPLSFFLYT